MIEGETVKPKINIKIKHVFALVFLIAFTLIVFRPYFSPGLPAGYDVIAHLSVVDQAKRIMDQTGTYVDWSDDWYGGHNLLHFYPPLSYFVMLPIYSATNDLYLTAKIFTVLGFLVAVLCAYLFALKLSDDEKHRFSLPAIAAAIVYAFNPFILSLTLARGLLPAIWAIALVPLTFVFLIETLRKPKLSNLVLYAISLSVVFLFHLHFGYIAGLGGGTYAIGFLLIKWYKGENSNSKLSTRDVLLRFGYVIAGLALFLAFTAFWWLPFFKEAPMVSTTPEWVVARISKDFVSFVDRGFDPWSERFGYLGISAILLSLPCLISRRNRAKSIGLLFMLTFGLLMAMGGNTPLYRTIPLATLMHPDRFLVICALALSGMVYLSLSFIQDKIYGKRWSSPSNMSTKIKHELTPRRILGVSLMFLVIGGITLDYSSTFSTVRVNPPDPASAFASACDWLKQQPSENGSRVVFVGDWGVATVAYSPVLTGKPTLRGYIGSSPVAWDITYATTDAITKKDNAFFLRLFSRFNVEYIAVRGQAALNTLMQTENFQELLARPDYTILRYLGKRGFVQPLGKILVIGGDADYKTNLISEIMYGHFTENMVFWAGASKYVDDYEMDYLSKCAGIILWGFDYHNKSEAEKLLSDYVAGGGGLVVCIDGGPKERFFGVEPREMGFTGYIDVTHSISPLDSPLTPIYEGGPWVAVHYEGLDENWLVTNGTYTIAGIKKVENRDVLFVGYNLFFHAAYHKNEAEKAFLGDLLSRLIPIQEQRVEYEIVSFEPDEKIIDVNTSLSGYVLISHAHGPHWKASVDGEAHEIENYEGLMSVWVENGSHRIVLTYVETPIHYLADSISISAFIGVILLFLLGEKLRVKMSSHRPHIATLEGIPPLTE